MNIDDFLQEIWDNIESQPTQMLKTEQAIKLMKDLNNPMQPMETAPRNGRPIYLHKKLGSKTKASFGNITDGIYRNNWVGLASGRPIGLVKKNPLIGWSEIEMEINKEMLNKENTFYSRDFPDQKFELMCEANKALTTRGNIVVYKNKSNDNVFAIATSTWLEKFYIKDTIEMRIEVSKGSDSFLSEYAFNGKVIKNAFYTDRDFRIVEVCQEGTLFDSTKIDGIATIYRLVSCG